MMRHRPTEPDLSRALAGDTKIPDPVEHKQQIIKPALSLLNFMNKLSPISYNMMKLLMFAFY
jgi:hypothetical protein